MKVLECKALGQAAVACYLDKLALTYEREAASENDSTAAKNKLKRNHKQALEDRDEVLAQLHVTLEGLARRRGPRTDTDYHGRRPVETVGQRRTRGQRFGVMERE